MLSPAPHVLILEPVTLDAPDLSELLSPHFSVRSFCRPSQLLAYAPSVESPVILLDPCAEKPASFMDRLDAAGLQLPVIVVTNQDAVSLVVDSFRAGAYDFCGSPFDKAALIAAIHGALAYHQRWLQRYAAAHAAGLRLRCLSPRERQIVDQAVRGKTCKEIGRDLGISSRTVEHHRAHIMQKLNAGNLLGVVHMACLAQDPDLPNAAPAHLPFRRHLVEC
jgi:two-component system, LuxR family, response regulator FixJ